MSYAFLRELHDKARDFDLFATVVRDRVAKNLLKITASEDGGMFAARAALSNLSYCSKYFRQQPQKLEVFLYRINSEKHNFKDAASSEREGKDTNRLNGALEEFSAAVTAYVDWFDDAENCVAQLIRDKERGSDESAASAELQTIVTAFPTTDRLKLRLG